jgi:hypothetical protein
MTSASLPATDSLRTSDCPRCRQTGREYYWYRGLYEFDVDRARALVPDGREPVEVDEESVRITVDETDVDECHLDHVDPTIPGIISHVFYRTEQGEEVRGHALIDGNHRAARCLRDGLPYFAYLLTEQESRQITLPFPSRKRRRPEPVHHQ